MTPRRLAAVAARLIAVLVVLVAARAAGAQAPAAVKYVTEQVSFQSDGLKIRALLARPPGDGPFPVVITTHGSMRADVAAGGPWTYFVKGSMSDLLAARGFAVLLVARRGHRGSEGTTLTYTHTSSRDLRLTPTAVMTSAQQEANDIVAAIEYVHTLPFVDRGRIGLSGHSLGGFVSVIAASRDPRPRALLSLAGGYRLTQSTDTVDYAWQFVDTEWRRFASKFIGTTMILWSENDTLLTVSTGEELAKQLRSAGKPVTLKVYPPFKENGHTLFSDPAGYPVWVPDAVRFFEEALGRPG
jgi:dienelactone hydrolase